MAASQRRIDVILHHLQDTVSSSASNLCHSKQEEILVSKSSNGLLSITLNRPAALNALNSGMIATLTSNLKQAERDRSIACVLIRGAGNAFCAGGDIRMLAESCRAKNYSAAEQFFSSEYRLNKMIYEYAKPYVALLHGVTMGGGVGLSIGAKYRIVTEKVVFAMPETGIGFFPDVTGTYFLSRLAGGLGMYAALTGARLRAADCLYAGVATHFMSSARVPELLQAVEERPSTIQSILSAFSTKPEGTSYLAANREAIDRCFSAGSVEEIIQRLRVEDSPFGHETLKTLQSKSPTSLKVTFEALRRAANLDLTQALKQELQIAMNFMYSHDFYEGVRAVVLEKDNKPKWEPATLEDVTDDMVASFFRPRVAELAL